MQRRPCSALRPLQADSVQGRSVLDVDLRLPRRAEVHWTKCGERERSGVNKGVCVVGGAAKGQVLTRYCL